MARTRIRGARSNGSSPKKVRRAYVKDKKPVALVFWCRKVVRLQHRVPPPHTERWYVLLWDIPADAWSGHRSVGWLYDFARDAKSEVLLQLFTSLLLCLCFPINPTVQQTVLSPWAERGKSLALQCYWAKRNIRMDLLNSGSLSAAEQKKKYQKNNQTTISSLSFLQLLISKLFFPTGWPQGSFILLPDLGLLPAFCSSPKCLWGFFCCHYSSMAACQLPEALSFLVTTLCWLHALCLAKLKLLVKMRHANLFFPC